MSSNIFKTTASSLAKVAALPRFRHPGDLLNAFTQPINVQRQQIEGELGFGNNHYFNNRYENLIKSIIPSRTAYRDSKNIKERSKIAELEYQHWENYLNNQVNELQNSKLAITQLQKQRIFQSVSISKERHEERLNLNRFIRFFYQYSNGFQVDIPLHPIVILKCVNPHYGYLNSYPSICEYKLNLDQLVRFLEELIAVSNIRQLGYTLHSQELFSFVLWRATFGRAKSTVSESKFITGLQYLKFKSVNEDNWKQKLAFSLKVNEWREGEKQVRFDLWRQIFLDRDL